MSSIIQIVNSIESMFEYGDANPDKVVSFILVEKWTHQDWEELEFHNLTNDEVDIVSEWVRINSGSYDRVRELVTDLKEVFPGLTTIAASWLVAPYCGNARLRRIK